MKYTSAVLAAAAAVAHADMTAFNEGGNWFKGAHGVSQIKYGGLDIPGSYRAVSKMTADGACEFTTKQYSGSIAPFDEDVRTSSAHVQYSLRSFLILTLSS